MEHQQHSSERPPKGGWIASIIDTVLSYYAYLVSQPFRSGLVYFLAGVIPSLIIGWFVFPVVLYSKQPQPIQFSHAIHSNPDIGIAAHAKPHRNPQHRQSAVEAVDDEIPPHDRGRA